MLGGLGILTSSSFFVPQVNVPGSMATFVTPSMIPVPDGSGGLGQSTIATTPYGTVVSAGAPAPSTAPSTDLGTWLVVLALGALVMTAMPKKLGIFG